MDLYEGARIFASFATAVGVGVAAWQIRRNAEQAKTSFEDSLAKEYRDLMRTVSYKALMGMAISDAEVDSSKEGIYNYLDFCNQQVYLRASLNFQVQHSSFRVLSWREPTHTCRLRSAA